jgi:hypothetical protein
MVAVAVPVRGSRGDPFGSLCVASIASRLDSQRCETVVRWLLDEVELLTLRFNDVTHGLGAPLMRRLRPADWPLEYARELIPCE